jgi:hypothetical protein
MTRWPGWNRSALRARFERVSPPPAIAPVGAAVAASGPSRRGVLRGAGIVASVAPFAGSATARGVDLKWRGGRVALVHDGEERFVLDPADFVSANGIGPPRVSARRGSDGIEITLTNARYPGADLLADFRLAASRREARWTVSLQLEGVGATASGGLEPWLDGRSDLTGRLGAARRVRLGEGGQDLLLQAGRKLEVDRNLAICVSGRGAAVLRVPEGRVSVERATLSHGADGQRPLRSRSGVSVTTIRLDGDRTAAWTLAATAQPPGAAFTTPSSLEVATVVAQERHGHRMASVVVDGAGGAFKPGPAVLDGAGAVGVLGLGRVQLALAGPPEARRSFLLASLEKSTDVDLAGAIFTLASAGETALEFETSGDVVVRGECSSAVERCALPLGDVVVRNATVPSGARISISYALKGAPPSAEGWGVLRLNADGDAVLRLKHLQLSVLRPRDLLLLRFEFTEVVLRRVDGHTQIFKDGNADSRMRVVFPPQHIVEEDLFYNPEAGLPTHQPGPDNIDPPPSAGPPRPIPRPLKSGLAKPSRIVFHLPPHMAQQGMPLTVNTLLDWADLQMAVGPRAIASPGAKPPLMPAHWRDDVEEPWKTHSPVVAPTALETEIEAPYGISLSPHAWSIWRHALEPVERPAFPKGPVRAELWHTRLGPFQADSLDFRTGVTRSSIDITDPQDPRSRMDLRTVRAVFSRPPNAKACDAAAGGSWERRARLPSAQDAAQIVQLSSNFNLAYTRPGEQPEAYRPPGIPYTRLHLSALGATAKLHGAWEPLRVSGGNPLDGPCACPGAQAGKLYVDEWVQDIATGRDQFVLVSYAGFTLWTGHAVSLVTTHERVFLDDEGSRPGKDGRYVAALRRRYYCEVREPTLIYPDDPEMGERRTGRRSPFREATIWPPRTPYLKRPWDVLSPDGSFVEGCPPKAFWMIPETEPNSRPFAFTIRAIDRQGGTVEFQMPLLWVLGTLAAQSAAGPVPGADLQKIVRDYYRTSPGQAGWRPKSDGVKPSYGGWRTADLRGQRVSYVADPVDDSRDRSVETDTLTFTVDLAGAVDQASDGSDASMAAPAASWPQERNWPLLFYPAAESAEVRLGAMARLAGGADIQQVRYNGWYAAYGFAKQLPDNDPDAPGETANAGGVYLDVFGVDMAFPTSRTGGMATPSLEIRHVGADGPVGGPSAKRDSPIVRYVPRAQVAPHPAANALDEQLAATNRLAGLAAAPINLNASASIKGLLDPKEMLPKAKLFGVLEFSEICRVIDGFDEIADAVPRLVEEYQASLGPIVQAAETLIDTARQVEGLVKDVEAKRSELRRLFDTPLASVVQNFTRQITTLASIRAGASGFDATLATGLQTFQDQIAEALRKVDAVVSEGDAQATERAIQALRCADAVKEAFGLERLRGDILGPLGEVAAALGELSASGFPFARLRTVPTTLQDAGARALSAATDPMAVLGALRDLRTTLREVDEILSEPNPIELERKSAAALVRRIAQGAYVFGAGVSGFVALLRKRLDEVQLVWFTAGEPYEGPGPSGPAGIFLNSRRTAFDLLASAIDALSELLGPFLDLQTGSLVAAVGEVSDLVDGLGRRLDRALVTVNGGPDRPNSPIALAQRAMRQVLRPVMGVVSAILDNVPQSVDLKYGWEPALKDAGPFIASRGGKSARLRLDIRLTQDLLTGGAPTYAMRGEMTDFGIAVIGGQPFLTVEVARLKFESRNGSSPKMDLTIGQVTFGDQLTFVAELAKLLNPDVGPYLNVTGDSVITGYRLPIPNITSGAFSLINLSINPELKFPLDGTPMRTRLAISSRQRPAIFGMGIFGGTLFVALECTPNEGVAIEAAIDGGVVAAIGFTGAQGVATITLGFYFQLYGQKALLTGYFRAYGSFDICGLITLNVEFYLGFTYRGNGTASGSCSITVEIGRGMFSIKVTARAERQMSGNGGARLSRVAALADGRESENPPPVVLSDAVEKQWGAYRRQFGTWAVA